MRRAASSRRVWSKERRLWMRALLTVRDVDRTCRFYGEVPGFERKTFGEDRTALHFGTQKINLR